mmetsp:Transcript_26390/g.32946  ORF Transcript_26390/g.32946 Transcript_26390/m.32946 type:complete len:87 (-) Transcript_26390:1052-1312(-)
MIVFLAALHSLHVKLELLDALLEHLVFIFKCLDLIDLLLLDGKLFFLLLYYLTHVIQVVGPSDESDFFEAEAGNLQIGLIVLVCFR